MSWDDHAVIVQLPRSMRSLWSPVTVLVGLAFALTGAATMTATSPGETKPTIVSGWVIGAFSVLLGLAFTWGGARMGAFRKKDGVRVRELFGQGRIYRPEEIAGFTTREHEHHTLPLTVIQPVIVLQGGFEVWLSSLASYRVIPGARRQARAAAQRMANWTDRPVMPFD